MVIDQADPSKVLVIRHEACSSVGLLGRFLKQQGIAIQYLDTPQGETLQSSLQEYSHLVVLGGAISAYEDQQYPFLREEFKLIENAIDRQIPVLGICLGSQILAKILGAPVYRGQAGREAGWCMVELTEAAKTDTIFQDFPQRFQVFESHQDTFDLPAGCTHLAFSNLYVNQAFRYQDYVWALQFHPEIDDQVLRDCAAVIAQELIDSKIEDTTVEQLIAEAKEHAPSVAPLAETIMRNFLQVKPRAYAEA
jgi:GMP synthase (glutamine-hydrolysing)